jgi:hypothetical protein
MKNRQNEDKLQNTVTFLYLHDPAILHQREVDSVFKMPTKKQIETLAKKLMSRLFPNDVTPEEDCNSGSLKLQNCPSK